MKLHNTVNGEELKEKIKYSAEKRRTLSFYTYAFIGNPQFFRDHLFVKWSDLGVLGRIYVASEGINAQLSYPTRFHSEFISSLNDIDFLKNIRLNYAVEDNGKSFFKLAIKVRPKIVADGLKEDIFQISDPAPYLTPESFNEITENPETILIDMRNHYESEVGHFKDAWCPDVDTFREQLPLVVSTLENSKERPIVMYCTGGIRCEKASAYMQYKGFSNVYHLEGGIIKYSSDAKEKGLKNLFVGKNFVFDERLHERITDDVIAKCHQCGSSFDEHVNCRNKACNLLFIQCQSCSDKFQGCCSDECMEIASLPEEKQRELRKGVDKGVRIFSKGRFKPPMNLNPK
jgi:UPF0176 protein